MTVGSGSNSIALPTVVDDADDGKETEEDKFSQFLQLLSFCSL
jgi:hypothetical protein